MTDRNQTSTRFKDELRIVSRWVYFFAVLVFLTVPVLFAIVVGRDNHAPPLAVRWLLGVLAGTAIACYAVLVGYINRDAGRRGMSRLFWTLVAIFVPNGLGIVLYFVLRKQRAAHCPQCDAEVEAGFSFCPRCRTRLRPVCPHCQRSVDFGDKFCPYCGGGLEAGAGVGSGAGVGQPM
jgi:hypothetical protein